MDKKPARIDLAYKVLRLGVGCLQLINIAIELVSKVVNYARRFPQFRLHLHA